MICLLRQGIIWLFTFSGILKQKYSKVNLDDIIVNSIDKVSATTFPDRWKNERCTSGWLHTIRSRYWDSQCTYYKTQHPREHKTKFWEHGTGAHQGIKWRTLLLFVWTEWFVFHHLRSDELVPIPPPPTTTHNRKKKKEKKKKKKNNPRELSVLLLLLPNHYNNSYWVLTINVFSNVPLLHC